MLHTILAPMLPPLITNCRNQCQMANLQNFYANGGGKVFRFQISGEKDDFTR